MTATSFSEIPRGVLARLLDMCGRPAEMSPRRLMGEAEPVNPLQIAQLYAGGYLSEAKLARETISPLFEQAAAVLLDPRTNLMFRIWGAEDLCAETNIQFPANLEDGGGVMLLPVSTRYRLSAFIEPGDVVSDLARALPPSASRLVNPFVFEGHFDAAVASVLFALIDLHRNEADRRKVYADHEIYGFLHGRWGLTGFDQLATYAQAAGMQSRPPSIVEVEVALARLEATGTVGRFRAGQYRISDELHPLVDLTRSLASGLQWERVTRQDNGEIVVNNRIYAYGDGGLTLCFIPTVKAKLYVGTVDHKSVLDFVIDEIGGLTRVLTAEEEAVPSTQAKAAQTAPAQLHALKQAPAAPPQATPAKKTAAAPPPIPPPPAPPPKPAAKPVAPAAAAAAGAAKCRSCGADLTDGQKFCSSCGAEVVREPAGPVCPSCGQPLTPGTKFCTSCGATLGATQRAGQGQATCSHCGAGLMPDLKFCTQCGRAVGT